MLRIAADENIPQVREALAGLGEVALRPGRSLSNSDLRGVDALLVRSVTRVDRALLEGTPVRFVGSATIGADHLDRGYLSNAGIACANAPGCNADSVVQFVFAAIMELAARGQCSWRGATLGIVGRGNIGSRLARIAPAFGMRVLVNDPPLERAGDPGPFVDLDTALAESDIVTLHTPLNREGPDRTVHLVGEEQLLTMKPDAVLVNASRGPVLDNGAALDAIEDGRIGALVLDVWEQEPGLDQRLLRRAAIATPHIAGYSAQGKLNGTRQVAEALAGAFGLPFGWTPSLPTPDAPDIDLPDHASEEDRIAAAVLHTYPIAEDDALLRGGAGLEGPAWAAHFDRLRKEYRVRLEPSSYRVRGARTDFERVALSALGFVVE